MRKLEANPYEADGQHTVVGIDGIYVYDGPPLGAVGGWDTFLPSGDGADTFVLPSVQAAGATPEDPEAKDLLTTPIGEVVYIDGVAERVIHRETRHPGRAARESYTEREEFLKKWRG